MTLLDAGRPGPADLPDPVVRSPAPEIDISALERDLRARVDGEVRFDPGSLGAYSTDASNFRQIPIGVVVPRTVEAGVEAVAVCQEHGAPLLSRGGGTSLSGECTNTAVVLDWSKYCTGLVSVDADARTCVVEPGIVLDRLNDLLSEHGLEFGPSPSTHSHCTLGGMIGNNSCGATAQRAGKVVDNIVRMEVLLYDGTRMWVGETPDDEFERIVAEGGRRAEVYRQLRALRDSCLAAIRTNYPHIPRRVSGYNLDSLLPEKHFHLAQALVGSESTLVTVLRAEIALIPVVKEKAACILAYPSIAEAADAIPTVLESKPIALEGLDDKLIGYEREKGLNPQALQLLPKGSGFLLVQFGGDTTEEADAHVDDLLRRVGRGRDDDDVVFFDDPAHEAQLWRIRESGLGATARVPGRHDTWPGWEDSAVDPSNLGDYIRDLEKLYEKYGYTQASIYGHFGQACVHTRIPFGLLTQPGVAKYRAFIEEAADLVVSYGGSFSGEHGDGQQRAELLPKMYGPELMRAFGQFKAIFDPDNRMNPGKVCEPNRLDEDLRLGADYEPRVGVAPGSTYFSYPDDHFSFDRAVLRCVGVGNCRRESGGVMCPSYMVTREEEHSTRGRARLLFEMLQGHDDSPISDGWHSTAVRDALDLCFACKGCKSDCPVNVDMATYKAEFLSHHYEGWRNLRRPLAHWSMGWLPLVAAVASKVPRLVNALGSAPVLSTVALKLAGADPRREVPLFADETLQDWFARRESTDGAARGSGERGEVLLWPDTFTNRFSPAVGRAAVEVLEAAGWRVTVPQEHVCCGLTWISTGQAAVAKRILSRTVDVLRDHVRRGGLVLGLEPSCTAVFRSDARELFPHDQDVRRLSQQTVTLAELLLDHTPGYQPPPVDARALIQFHCHHHAVMGTDRDLELLKRMGADAEALDSGCCGLAGNFGFEAGHYDVSMAAAERVLLPALRDADPSAAVLADGFSCRTQIEQGDSGGRRGIHLAELLHMAMRNTLPASVECPEEYAERPSVSKTARYGVLASAVAGAGLAALAGAAAVRSARG